MLLLLLFSLLILVAFVVLLLLLLLLLLFLLLLLLLLLFLLLLLLLCTHRQIHMGVGVRVLGRQMRERAREHTRIVYTHEHTYSNVDRANAHKMNLFNYNYACIFSLKL